MKSGLEDRNNEQYQQGMEACTPAVSMKSGLEDRNNDPTQSIDQSERLVSMKSGLEDRNNMTPTRSWTFWRRCLNEVRPGRPEQYRGVAVLG